MLGPNPDIIQYKSAPAGGHVSLRPIHVSFFGGAAYNGTMRFLERGVRAGRPIVVVTCMVCWAGCDQAAVRRRQLNSDNPLDRSEAIMHAYEARDMRAVHKLVGLLDDPSDAVRMYAIQALRRLCGVDYGYRFYASAAEREPAVQRWREALRAGQITLRPAAPVAVSDEGGVPATAGSAP